MNIAMIHFRVGETDGVSLEMDKWKLVLEKLGHHVIYIAAEDNIANTFKIEELSIYSDNHKKLFHNCFEKLDDYSSIEELIDDVYEQAEIIKSKLMNIINNQKIDLVIPNNVSSLGLNLAVGIAISKMIDETGVDVIYHHHDFYWERDRYSTPTDKKINDILYDYFPNNKHNATHCVINRIAKTELKKRKNIESIVVPNVFDFSQNPWKKDDYNNDLREKLGIRDNDIVFLQATRIEDRKAIELAIDTIEAFNQNISNMYGKKLYNKHFITKDTKVFLVMPGLNELRQDKLLNLMEKVNSASFEVMFINNIVKATRNQVSNQKIYALWDIYTISDFVTYPSVLEGWGNQFIEAIFARKPILIYEYPVYETDIKPMNFQVVCLGNQHKLNEKKLIEVDHHIIMSAADNIYKILLDNSLYSSVTSHNYNIAKQHLSFNALRILLDKMLRKE